MSRQGETSPLRSYGRRLGRPLRPLQQQRLEKKLPQWLISLPPEGECHPSDLFASPPDECWMEIGFGGGEHLAAQAEQHPQIGMIGCEPFINGVAKLLSAIDRRQLTNIRIWPEDARRLIERLAPASLARIFILFPDPWPKMRHRKRRLVSAETLAIIARIVPLGGELRLTSDHVDYVAWMLEVMQHQPWFDWTAKGPEDFREPPADWVRTRYQEKTEKAGRAPVFLIYKRNTTPSLNAHSSA